MDVWQLCNYLDFPIKVKAFLQFTLHNDVSNLIDGDAAAHLDELDAMGLNEPWSSMV